MKKSAVKIRLMEVDDFDAVVLIDEKVLKANRADYYRMKFENAVQSPDHLPTSLVAEQEGKVIGFVLGDLFIGEYGITQDKATLDTIGVDPDYQRQGVGALLIREFMDHVKSLGVKKITTLVDMDDASLSAFFRANEFGPSKIINLERTL